MASVIPGFEYDIFISYRQNDNAYDGWVTSFVENLKRELIATFKDEVSIHLDAHPTDGLRDHHTLNDGRLKSKEASTKFTSYIEKLASPNAMNFFP
jgi:hypothetical protein